MRISIQKDQLYVELTDNGRGFPLQERQPGEDGLANMHERLKALEGDCQICSVPGQGTTVRFQAPLPRRLL